MKPRHYYFYSSAFIDNILCANLDKWLHYFGVDSQVNNYSCSCLLYWSRYCHNYLFQQCTHRYLYTFINKNWLATRKGCFFAHKLTVTLSSIAIESVSCCTVAGVRSVGIQAGVLTAIHVSGTFINILYIADKNCILHNIIVCYQYIKFDDHL